MDSSTYVNIVLWIILGLGVAMSIRNAFVYRSMYNKSIGERELQGLLLDHAASALRKQVAGDDSAVVTDPKEKKAIADLTKRMEAMEARLPNVKTVDKIANINDAVLATKLERLQEDVTSLEKRMLTPLKALGWVVPIAIASAALIYQALDYYKK